MAPLSPMESISVTKDMSNWIDTEDSFSSLLEFAADNNVEGFKRSVFDESEVKEIGLCVDVLKLLLSLPEVDVNFSCGPDNSTALHCAASGGSVNATNVVKLLLLAGADSNATDANRCRPIDVVAPSKFPDLKSALEELLNNGSVCQWDTMPVSSPSLRLSSPSLSSSTDEGSLSSPAGSILSPVACKPNDVHVSSAKKVYPVDPTIPDIKNCVYASDEFRMFSFKIRPCCRAYAHDWTECPFVHPGENARRRDPRKFHYSCMQCPDHKKGTCRRGDLCEYAHGIFECWLHPSQYKTRLCKEGRSCMRRVCFFAHTPDEQRPLNMSTGAAVSNNSHSSVPWPRQTIPNFHSSLQASCLRSSLNARDISSEDLTGLWDFGFQQRPPLNEPSPLSRPHYNGSSTNLFSSSNTLNHSNLDKILSENVSSPHHTDQLGGGAAFVFPPTYSSAALNQLQQQQSIISPMQGVSPYINDHVSSLGFQLSAHVQREKMLQQLQSSLLSQKLGCKASYDLGSNDTNSRSIWESDNRNVDRFVQADEMGRKHTSRSIKHDGEEPDVSWVHQVLKD
ncbi:zinc finger CCCH domain-containing protein 56-like [Populus alba x Populus x berolinensis]|nr:zinc finger CCCH domain-containing protein 56-like [Populus alba x Populus x berolinensis]